MTELQKNTEERILSAAREIFMKKGFQAVRMEEIAIEAGVNKSALHYYFRSKEKLFDKVLDEILRRIGSELSLIWNKDIYTPENLKGFVSMYIDLLIENPDWPFFIINELNRNPENLQNIRSKFSLIKSEAGASKDFANDDLNHLICLLSLCTFPFLCAPAICILVFDNDIPKYQNFLNNRKEEITDLVIKSIMNNKNGGLHEKRLFEINHFI